MLTLDGITLRLGGHLVLDRATASLPPKAHVGLVGRNGAGKSTLLKVIAGLYETDEGRVRDPVRDAHRLCRAGSAGRHCHALRDCARRGGGTRCAAGGSRARTETRIASARSTSGSMRSMRTARRRGRRAFSPVSASPRRRSISRSTAFPAAGACGSLSPRCSSPSPNFCCSMSLRTISISRRRCGSKSFLKDYRGSLIVVSHERDLLNNVADHLLHLERGGLTLYRGNYDSFARQRAERAAEMEAARGRQEAKAKKLQAYVDRWRYKAHTARQAQSRLKALASHGADRRRIARPLGHVRFSEPERAQAASDRARRRRRRLRARASRCCRGSICASIPTTASR